MLQIPGCENIDQIPTPGLFKNTSANGLLCSFANPIYIPRVTLRGWGGEQVMSLHPCVTLQCHRNARFSIRDTAYCTIPFRAFSCSLWGIRHQPHHPGATRPLVPTVGLEPTSRAFRCSIPSRTKALPVELCRHIVRFYF